MTPEEVRARMLAEVAAIQHAAINPPQPLSGPTIEIIQARMVAAQRQAEAARAAIPARTEAEAINPAPRGDPGFDRAAFREALYWTNYLARGFDMLAPAQPALAAVPREDVGNIIRALAGLIAQENTLD